MNDSVNLNSRSAGGGSGSNFTWIHLVSFLILGVVLVMTAWAAYQRYSFTSKIASIEAQVQEVDLQLSELGEQKLDAIVVAQQTVETIEQTQILWSEVVTHLLNITPLDVVYRSYSASSEGNMSVSVLTDSYDSAAQLISILNKDTQFGGAFVSSITKGSSESGSEVVSFGITFNVHKNE